MNLWGPNLMYVQGLRNCTKYANHDSRSRGRDMKLEPTKYEAGVVTTRLRGSVVFENNKLFDSRTPQCIHLTYSDLKHED
jgi:hypothetical protein